MSGRQGVVDCGRSRIAARRRAGIAFAALALLLHAVLIGGLGVAPVWLPEPAATTDAMSVRTVEAAPVVAVEVPMLPAVPVSSRVEATSAAAEPAIARRRSPTSGRAASAPIADAAAASAAVAAAGPPSVEPISPASPIAASATAEAESARQEIPLPDDRPRPFEVSASSSAGQPSDSPFGAPPPVYRVLLPPALTLRYEVRRGFLRGTGEIRWQPAGDRYALDFDARLGGLVLLQQTSEGAIDPATGIAPERFVDRRVRRSAQAVNFDRAAGRISFSGPSRTYPLVAGSQDRLSLFFQLAGIAAADPARFVEGATISMVVVGARGDAAVWQLRVAGREPIETAAGTVLGVKVVREARHPGDTGAEIWLDPERHWLPAHATLRNAAGASEFDLLLEGVSSGP